MKSLTLLIISFLLVAAILVPSIIPLTNIGENTILVIDFNEEEKKEVTEKDFFFGFHFNALFAFDNTTSRENAFYLEKNYSFSRTIFLPPPKRAMAI